MRYYFYSFMADSGGIGNGSCSSDGELNIASLQKKLNQEYGSATLMNFIELSEKQYNDFKDVGNTVKEI